jgi:hypothetical protein
MARQISETLGKHAIPRSIGRLMDADFSGGHVHLEDS